MKKHKEEGSELLLKCRWTPKGHLACRIVDDYPEQEDVEPVTHESEESAPILVCGLPESEQDFCIVADKDDSGEDEEQGE